MQPLPQMGIANLGLTVKQELQPLMSKQTAPCSNPPRGMLQQVLVSSSPPRHSLQYTLQPQNMHSSTSQVGMPTSSLQQHLNSQSLSIPSNNWRTWQTDTDYEERKQLITHIFQLFTGKQRANSLRPEFKDKLPDFVRRLEEALYRTAHSKDEYTDINTLESRLQNVARRMIRPVSFGYQSLNSQTHVLQTHCPLHHKDQDFQHQNQLQAALHIDNKQDSLSEATSPRQAQILPQASISTLVNSPVHDQIQSSSVVIASEVMDPSSEYARNNHNLKAPFSSHRTSPNISARDNSNLQPKTAYSLHNSGSETLMRNMGLPSLHLRGNALRERWTNGYDMYEGGENSLQNAVGGNCLDRGVIKPDLSVHQPVMSASSSIIAPAMQGTVGNIYIPSVLTCNQQDHLSGNIVNIRTCDPSINQQSKFDDLDVQIEGSVSSIHHSAAVPDMQLHGTRQYSEREVEALRKQQKWLLFLRHCIKCTAPQGHCSTWGAKCQHGKNLIRHIEKCNCQDCGIPQCLASKKLLKHHQRCHNPSCLVCGPVNNHVERQRQAQLLHHRQLLDSSLTSQLHNGQNQHGHLQDRPSHLHSNANQLGPDTHDPFIHQHNLLHHSQNLHIPPSKLRQHHLQNGQAVLRGPSNDSDKQRSPVLLQLPGNISSVAVASPPIDGIPIPVSIRLPTDTQSSGSMLNIKSILSKQEPLNQTEQPVLQMDNFGTVLNHPAESPGIKIDNSSLIGQASHPPGNHLLSSFHEIAQSGDLSFSNSVQCSSAFIETTSSANVETPMAQLSKRVRVTGQFSMNQTVSLASNLLKVNDSPKDAIHVDKGRYKSGPHCTSLIETFTEDQIISYLAKLTKESIFEGYKAKRKDDKNTLLSYDEVPCSACLNSRKSYFEPPVLYCSKCDKRIKESLVFYHAQLKIKDPLMVKGNQNKDYYWCHSCYSDVSREKGDTIRVDDDNVPKSSIIKKKNDDIQEEGWVQCDACDSWVHQICGLFNRLLNDDNNTHYQCPQCLLKGLKSKFRVPLTIRPRSMLEAKDLPKTKLSDFLEDYMKKAVCDERFQRARSEGRSVEEVLPIEGLTIRVVNNVVKKCETKPNFYRAFMDKNYPQFFNYRQKVILLFQKLDGIDICLYCMYTQEYGDDNPLPNRRVSYLSYLDSIKYFQPEGITAANRNVALRTFVYHEILIGYLAYLKKRGFYQMFIWACPPTQGDDYILYAHPKTQKNPQLSKLREWYFKMLRHAHEIGVVCRVSNLYDTFFDGGKDHRIENCSVMDIPYFEGDYWPGVAEVHIKSIHDEQQKGAGYLHSSKKSSHSRCKISKGKPLSLSVSTDEQLMLKLGENISGGNCNKDDLMVVNLQHFCSLCRTCIQAANRYFTVISPLVKFDGIRLESGSTGMGSIELCEECYKVECLRAVDQGGQGNTRNRSLPGGISVQDLKQEFVPEIPSTIEEWDSDMENEIFNTRQQFLSLCQGNHYQFDTMRRTRHSSMMVLYHLHNPTAPAFAGTCNSCNNEIEPGDGYRCTVCDDYDMCRSCYARPIFHEHPMVHQSDKPLKVDAMTMLQRRKAVQHQVQQTLELVRHSSVCTADHCSWHKCDTIKKVIAHMKDVVTWRQPHDCKHCRQMGKILKYHSSTCTQLECKVYMCKELKDAMRRIAQRQAAQEQHRAQAYQNMMAQQRQAGL